MMVSGLENAALVSSTLLVFAHLGLSKDKLIKVGPFQYFVQALYAVLEPTIMRFTDFLLARRLLVNTKMGLLFLRFIASLCTLLPHGIILSVDAAKKLLCWIEEIGTPQGPLIAVGTCICQRALNRWSHPVVKDIVIVYGAEIYPRLKAGYRFISAAEGGAILQECYEAGLVHTLDFCAQSGRWSFVICNCDRDICVLMRSYLISKRFLYAGPEAVRFDVSLCLGADPCGLCIGVCYFGVISKSASGLISENGKCMGCGQCARVCKTGAMTMIARDKFAHRDKLPEAVFTPTPTGR
jgi:ferredoxin